VVLKGKKKKKKKMKQPLKCSVCVHDFWNKNKFSRKGSVNLSNLSKFKEKTGKMEIKLGKCCNDCYQLVFETKKTNKKVNNNKNKEEISKKIESLNNNNININQNENNITTNKINNNKENKNDKKEILKKLIV
jgi:hypothetical protein